MATAARTTRIPRPSCPLGHDGTVRAHGPMTPPGKRRRTARAGDGYFVRWRFRCLPVDGAKAHTFTWPVSVRQSTHQHPLGAVCPKCDHPFDRGDGMRTPFGGVYTFEEQADIIIGAGTGPSFRQVARDVRVVARRGKTSDEDVSREARQVTRIVDLLAPVVLAKRAPERWPAVVSLDTRPLTRAGWQPGMRPRKKGGRVALGEVIAVVDHTRPGLPVIATAVLGGKDRQSVLEFLRTLGGEPEWVVADLDESISGAVREQWPSATRYHCEDHVKRLALEAMAGDGIERWELRPVDDEGDPLPMPEAADEAERRFLVEKYRGRGDGEYVKADVYAALELAQRSADDWTRFRAILERDHPHAALLLDWADAYEPLVLAQVAIKAGRAGKLYARNTSKVEMFFAEVAGQMDARRFYKFQNAQRFGKLLGLMAMVYNGVDRDELKRDIRDYYAANAGRCPVKAEPLLLGHGATTLDSRRAVVEDRIRRDEARRDNAQKVRRLAEASRARAESGAGPLLDRKRRADGVHWNTPKPTRGRTLLDFPAVLATWHPTRNGGEDPALVRAQLEQTRWWRCPVDVTHEWQAQVYSRTQHDTGCPYCTNRKVCRTNSLARLFPEIAAEWHPMRNGAIGPDQVLPGSATRRWWLCPRGHEYQKSVTERRKQKYPCPTCWAEMPPEEKWAGRSGNRSWQRDAPLAAAGAERLLDLPEDEIF